MSTSTTILTNLLLGVTVAFAVAARVLHFHHQSMRMLLCEWGCCLVNALSMGFSPQGPEIAIFQTDEVMGAMNAWCIEHHGKSGLTKR
eukprot:104362-Pelagomonas_calceolata.AAC.15